MARVARAALLFLGVLILSATPSLAATRVALIFGNSAYQNVPRLANPINDARAVAAKFKEIGFSDVTLVEDADFRAMRLAMQEFARKSATADIAVLYYAGHGIEVNGINYLIPIDAKLAEAVDVEFEAISFDTALSSMNDAKKLRLVVLDACRNNPFVDRISRGTRAVGRGLARIEPEANTLVAYSAKSGTTALDGTGSNSPYAEALLGELSRTGLEIGYLFRRVRDRVLQSTGGRQEPFTYGSLGGDAIFLGPEPAAGDVGDQPFESTQGSGDKSVQSPLSEAATAWIAVKDTTSVAVLRAYIKRFEGTVFSDLAGARLAEIESGGGGTVVADTTTDDSSSSSSTSSGGKTSSGGSGLTSKIGLLSGGSTGSGSSGSGSTGTGSSGSGSSGGTDTAVLPSDIESIGTPDDVLKDTELAYLGLDDVGGASSRATGGVASGGSGASVPDGAVRLAARVFPVGRWAEGVAYDGRSLWVAESGDRSIVEVNPSSGQIGKRVEVGRLPVDMVSLSDGRVLSLVQTDRQVWQGTRGKGRVLAKLPECPNAMTAAGSYAWVLTQPKCSSESSRVFRIDTKSGSSKKTGELGEWGQAIAAGHGKVYVAHAAGPALTIIDQKTLKSSVSAHDDLSLWTILTTDTSVYAGGRIGQNNDRGVIVEIDPRTGIELNRLEVGERIARMTSDGAHVVAVGAKGTIWVVSAFDFSLERVIALTTRLDTPSGVVILGDSLVITNQQSGGNEAGAVYVVSDWQPR
ncbi:MAG: caspase family protein [Hyphomicrobiaceae bacterium]